jgi:hypothetical protein
MSIQDKLTARYVKNSQPVNIDLNEVSQAMQKTTQNPEQQTKIKERYDQFISQNDGDNIIDTRNEANKLITWLDIDGNGKVSERNAETVKKELEKAKSELAEVQQEKGFRSDAFYRLGEKVQGLESELTEINQRNLLVEGNEEGFRFKSSEETNDTLAVMQKDNVKAGGVSSESAAVAQQPKPNPITNYDFTQPAHLESLASDINTFTNRKPEDTEAIHQKIQDRESELTGLQSDNANKQHDKRIKTLETEIENLNRQLVPDSVVALKSKMARLVNGTGETGLDELEAILMHLQNEDGALDNPLLRNTVMLALGQAVLKNFDSLSDGALGAYACAILATKKRYGELPNALNKAGINGLIEQFQHCLKLTPEIFHEPAFVYYTSCIHRDDIFEPTE